MAQPEIKQHEGDFVRAKCCRGCLYSCTPLAGNASEAKDYIARTEERNFYCHHSEDGFVICAGFYARHPERINNPVFTGYVHKNYSIWDKIQIGDAKFNAPSDS